MNVEDFWQQYLDSLTDDNEQPDSPVAWSFGDSPEMADELVKLVLDGIKTGTSCLEWDYVHNEKSIPRAGDHSIVLDSQGEPLCIIETTWVNIEPFYLVGENQAYAEGEGDRSLQHWRSTHWDYFSRRCETIGRKPIENMPVVCERFRVVWKHKNY